MGFSVELCLVFSEVWRVPPIDEYDFTPRGSMIFSFWFFPRFGGCHPGRNMPFSLKRRRGDQPDVFVPCFLQVSGV